MTIEDFCGGVFFDPQQTVNTSDPQFTNCFTEIIIELVPSYFIWLFALPYYFYLGGCTSSRLKVSQIFKLKIIITATLWLLAWIEFFYGLHDWLWSIVDIPPADIVSPCLVGLSMALVLFFINYERMMGVRTSGILFIYWLLTLVLWLIPFRAKVELLQQGTQPFSNGDILRILTTIISYVLVFVSFILVCCLDSAPIIGDPGCPREQEEEEEVVIQPGGDKNAGKTIEKAGDSPELTATFLSWITYWWITGLFLLGYKRPLESEDMWKLNKDDESGRVTKLFLKQWNAEKEKYAGARRSESTYTVFNQSMNSDREVLIQSPSASSRGKKKKPSLLFPLLRTFLPYFTIGMFLKFLNDLLNFVSPQLLKLLIQFTKDESAPVWQGYFLAALFFIAAEALSLIFHQSLYVCYVTGMRIRSAIISAVYRKSLRLSNSARKTSTVGEVVNLMSVDAQRFMDLMTYVNAIWSAPLQIALSIYFLWNILGPSVLAGVAVMILLIPVNGIIAKKSRTLQVKQMKFKDSRIKQMNEVLNGMKVLKLYAWETSFQKKILGIRDEELKVLRSAAYLSASSTFTWFCAPFLVSLATFAVYVLVDETNVLDAEKAFVSLSLFNVMKFPLAMLPMTISSLVQANVSLKRLNKFMNNSELQSDSVDRENSDGPPIKIENGTFSWGKEEPTVLEDINCEIEEGSLVAIVGQVGAGKSSLISALLGDMEKEQGYVKLYGSVAYVAQQAWIQNATVRENILFGKPMDVCKYNDIIEACELKTDFDVLPAGDLTEIGEKGINLSGGQKQRVSIARAVYNDAKVYLFDDPLSAVDAHVGKNIFENVLGPKGYLKNKTRVLVTHGISFLPQVDKIIVLKDGRISETGDYSQLQDRDGDFAEFLRTYAGSDDDLDDDEEGDATVGNVDPDVFVVSEEEDEENPKSVEPSVRKARRSLRSERSRSELYSIGSRRRSSRMLLKKKLREGRVCKLPEQKKPLGDTLIEKETAETGRVKMRVYIAYAQSIGTWLCILICALFIAQNAAQVYSSIWLADWSNDPVVNGTQSNTGLRLGVYGALGLGQSLFVLFSSFIISYGSVLAAGTLHRDMLYRVFRAPMSFFDTTPLGRIINRFSKDIYLIDEVIPMSFQFFLSMFFTTVSTFAVIIYGIPIFATVVIPLMILYYVVQRFFIATSRQLQRLVSISRSPIYSHFGETVTGTGTIRAYNLQKGFIRESEQKVDLNQMSYYLNAVANRWLGVRLEFVGNCVVLFAAIFAVAGKETINAGIVGLVISYALEITSALNWMIRQVSELETNIVAIERVKEYTEIEQEADLLNEDSPPPRDWPKDGLVEFRDYSTRYRPELDLVVKDISVNIAGGEKIGIAGRTGAGKSSMTLALFRIIESAGGAIVIDGLNIASLGLHELRSKISIIPQDPVLFSGSLRMNLDPFDSHTDEQIWDALEHSHLKPFVSGLGNKLEHEIAEGGENLSVGQRQLVCLARALLRRSKILVLDEATAAVDLETDDLIQATIRIEFKDCTTFTIAHRLNTIMDCTRVLVLDAGKVAEFDTPANLLQTKGIFYGMAKDAGLA